VIRDTFAAPLARPLRWIDLFTGPAPQFDHAPAGCELVGIDASIEQLAVARKRHPHARFIDADVRSIGPLDLGAFSIVSVFWGAYSYLPEERAIGGLLRQMHALTAQGGAILIEVIDPTHLESFNETSFAKRHGCRVRALDPTRRTWLYEDPGGTHRLCSPPVSYFCEALAALDLAVEIPGGAQTLLLLRAWRRMNSI
jgi:trans-aconitate methyltransferase